MTAASHLVRQGPPFTILADQFNGVEHEDLIRDGANFLASGAFAADCATNRLGQTVCGNGQSAVAVNPNKGTVTTAKKSPSGVTTAQSSNGSKAAYNPHTGNATVSQTNQNGVKTTQTSNGAKAKTKNCVGVATGPNGTTCVKGVNNQACRK